MCVVLSINRVDGGAFGRCTCANPRGHSRRACGQATQSEQQCHAYPAVIIFIMCACGLRATDTRYMILIREYNNSLSDLGDCESTVHISFKSSKYFLFNRRLDWELHIENGTDLRWVCRITSHDEPEMAKRLTPTPVKAKIYSVVMRGCRYNSTRSRHAELLMKSLSDLGDCESTVHISFKSSKYFLFNLRLLQKAVRAVNNKHTRYGLTVNRGCGQLRAVASCGYYQ